MAMWAKHHLLPEFYLRHFVDPATPAGMKNPYVWRYDLAEQRWQRKGPENKILAFPILDSSERSCISPANAP
jgi:hypothetical protein